MTLELLEACRVTPLLPLRLLVDHSSEHWRLEEYLSKRTVLGR